MTAVAELAPTQQRSPAKSRLQARKLTPFIGSEITGVDLKEPQSAETIAELREILFDRSVIFLRDQHLSPAQQLAATAYFGTPNIPEGPRAAEGSPLPGIGVIDSINEIAGRVSRWHADVTSAEAPSTIRLLQAITLPEIGGDTLWASTEAAYDRLSEPLKRLAESLTATHALTPIKISEWGKGRLPFHWNNHPVVRLHPETGRKSLFVNPRFTPEIVGLRPHESAAVLKVFFDHIIQPEHQVRFQWEVGSLAIWDNRNFLHYAADDYGDARRIMYGSGVQGERPVGIGG